MGGDKKKRRSSKIWKKIIDQIGNEKGKSPTEIGIIALNKTKWDRWIKNK